MLNILKPPHIPEVEIHRKAKIIERLIWGSAIIITAALILAILIIPQNFYRWISVIGIYDGICTVVLILINKGYIRTASIIFISLLIILVLTLAATAGGIKAPVLEVFPMVVLSAGIILGWRGGIIVGLIGILGGLLLIVADNWDLLPADVVTRTPFSYWIIFAMYIGLLILLQYYAVSSLDKALHKAENELSIRKSAEENLRVSEEKYSKLFQFSPDAIIVTELKSGVIFEVNNSFEKFSGFTRSELIGRPVLELNMYGPDQRAKFVARLQKDGFFDNIEYTLKNKSGKLLYVLASAAIIKIKDGTYALTILKDITDRKQSEDALRSSEEKYRELVENLNDVIFTLDSNGIITYVSPATRDLYGYEPEELLGHPFSEIVYPEDLKIVQKAFEAIMMNKAEAREFRYQGKTGIVGWALTSSRPIFEGENIIGIRGIFSDITKRKHADIELIQAKEKAEASEKMKTHFLAQMSHEIRTPLNIIIGNSAFIKEEVGSKFEEEYKDIFEGVESSGMRIIRTIDLMLNMSELQTGFFEPEFSEIDIDEDILKIVIKEQSPAAKSRKLNLVYHSKGNNTKIRADKYCVMQIFTNLIDNALKYTLKGSVEVLLGNNSEGKIFVEVKDTGIGMSKEFQENLFKPFLQEDQGYTRRYDGTGLGLALVKKYCEINNATINYVSQKGIGTTFTVTFNNI